MYIGQTDRSIETRIKEHHQHTRLGHPDKSAVAELVVNHNHLIKFQDTWIFSTVPGYMDYLIRQAVELELHPDYEQGGWPDFVQGLETSFSSP